MLLVVLLRKCFVDICTVISMKLDEFMEARVPDYKGCMPKDDWETIINYNFSDD